ncbi:MAG: bifunctional serine/threonine-protein kinase/formylglycine-generating enzyme family protein [Planctomycetota bacterium]
MYDPCDDVSSVSVEFLALFAGDQVEGRPRALAEYLTLFPGHEREIVAAWLSVQASVGAPRPGDTRASAVRDAPAAAGHEGGALTLGPYTLRRELGRGAQGIVWLAVDRRFGREVALKTAPRSPLFASLGPRLEREAQALARIQHPGLSVVYDVGATESVSWIAMRFEQGRTLAELIASGALQRRSGVELVGWIEQAARALEAAHTAGFLHRDIKPSNLLVRDDGVVVVLDFGVAAHDDAAAAPLTLTGDLVGTPAYMAPEQLTTSIGAPDRRADVWALGVTLYEALAGVRPFTAPTREGEARRALTEDPLPLSADALHGLDRKDLETVIATALAKEPRHRYSTAAHFADDLARLGRGESPSARRPGPLLRAGRWARRRPGLAAALAALVVFAVATAVLFVHSNAQLRDIRRLADLETAQRLLAQRAELFPLTPDSAPRAQGWLRGADELLAQRPLHEAALAALPPKDETDDGWSRKGGAANAWLRAQFAALFARFDELRARREWLAARVALARDLEQVTLVEPAAAWRAAAARVRADARFAASAARGRAVDFELEPQLGLVPLGPDPASGLEEFAHVASGAVPRRDPETGALALSADMCVVFVLVPFGVTTVGCSEPSAGGPNPDPDMSRWDGPPQVVRLDPYFIAKYEFTRGQWERQTGGKGGYYDVTADIMLDAPLLHPAEYVTDVEVREVLRQLGLQLPTEVQWEHAARAGTTTPWSFGADVAEIGAYANIADETARERQADVGWDFADGVRDGYAFHAPVGRLRPNPWGLHDVHGNVRELTRSTWEDWAELPPRDGDGATEAKYDLLSIRGGCFDRGARSARSGLRDGQPGRVPTPSRGFRALLPYTAR